MKEPPTNVSPSVRRINPHLYPTQPASGDGVISELPLHDEIIRHCNSQCPRWKYIHARTDQKSTIGVGVHDFTIFLPGGRVLCIECKTRLGKLTPEQLAWKLEMEMLGHAVHVVRSFQEFIVLTNEP